MSGYQPVPTTESEPFRLSRATPLSPSTRAEFDRRPPAIWKRLAIIFAILFFGWAAVKLGGLGQRKPEVIYASRYSDEFKYRPAASPVITEYLKDGRLRIRGASVGAMGVRPEDVPKTPAQRKLEKDKQMAEAREAAKERLGLKSGRRTNKGKKGAKGKAAEP